MPRISDRAMMAIEGVMIALAVVLKLAGVLHSVGAIFLLLSCLVFIHHGHKHNGRFYDLHDWVELKLNCHETFVVIFLVLGAWMVALGI